MLELLQVALFQQNTHSRFWNLNKKFLKFLLLRHKHTLGVEMITILDKNNPIQIDYRGKNLTWN